MADYAGAVAAMRTKFVAEWVSGITALTPIAFQNEEFADQSSPWVYFEVLATQSDIRGAGTQGNNIWLTTGYINIYVFTPLNYGYPESLRLADLAGEIFRAQTFYQNGDGSKVVCMAPMTDGGATDADNGNWFRVTTAIPFEFFFIK